MKFKSLQSKFTVIISIVVIVILASIISYVAIRNRQELTENSKTKLILLAEGFSLKLEAEIEIAMDATNTMASSLASLKTKNSNKIDRGVVNNMLKQILLDKPSFLATYTLWEPNAFDNRDSFFRNKIGHDETGRFIPYWTNTEGNFSVKPLVDYTVEGDGDYYLIPKKTGNEAIIKPYIYPVNGKDVLITSIVSPIIQNNTFYGIVGVDIAMDFIEKQAEKIKDEIYNGNVNIEIISNNGIYAANAMHPELVGKSISSNYSDADKFISEIKKGEETIYTIDETLIVGIPLDVGLTNTPWQVRVSVDESVIYASIRKNITIIIIIGILGLFIIIAIIIFISKRIVSPLKDGVDFAEKIAAGNLTADLTFYSNDEVGNLSNALRTMSKKLRTVVEDISQGVDNILRASNQINSTSQELSQGANEQATSTEEMSSTMEEMVSNIQQNTDNSRVTAQISTKAQNETIDAGDKAKQSAEAQNLISEKITIINDIAFQTNILALNAAVEAARAGEHGKGFAVVALEVRKLAERSKIAAEEIIYLSQNSKELSDKAGESLSNVIPRIEQTANLLQEIASASIEQNSGAEQVNNAIQQLNQVAQQNAVSSEELASTSEEMTAQAQQLREAISYFKIK